MNPNCISYWFPYVLRSGVPVPRTHILGITCDIGVAMDGAESRGFDEFVKFVEDAAEGLEFPCFLRFGCGSGKHDWKDCCYVEDRASVRSRIIHTCQDQAIKGLDYDKFVVLREMLDVEPLFTAFHGKLPVTREFRIFGKVQEVPDAEAELNVLKKKIRLPKYAADVYHVQPYWPAGAIERHAHAEGWRPKLQAASVLTQEEWGRLQSLASDVIMAFKYAEFKDWSMDFLQDKHGRWFLTDMAIANNSYKWQPEFEVVRMDEEHKEITS